MNEAELLLFKDRRETLQYLDTISKMIDDHGGSDYKEALKNLILAGDINGEELKIELEEWLLRDAEHCDLSDFTKTSLRLSILVLLNAINETGMVTHTTSLTPGDLVKASFNVLLMI